MQKVIIADDEAKVCQLIALLVDWNALDMEIAAIAHNGIEVLELIPIHNPSLIITDIRMPGYDGLEMIRRAKEIDNELEFIIISGYRYFDYAQSAIKYGVSDYLLKPIKQNELTNTLIKMKEKFEKNKRLHPKKSNLDYLLKNDIKKLRSGLFTEILLNKNAESSMLTPQKANRDFHYNFKNGIFQIAILKPDVGFDNQYDNSIRILNEKISLMASKTIQPLCFEFEIFWQDCYGYCVLNYSNDERKNIRKGFKILLDEIFLQRTIFESLEITVGLGTSHEDFSNLAQSMRSAKAAIFHRLVAGTGKIIDDVVPSVQNLNENAIYHTACKSLAEHLQTLDKDAVSLLCQNIKNEIVSDTNISGEFVINFANSFLSTFLFILKNNGLPVNNEDRFLENAMLRLARCNSAACIFDFVSAQIETVIHEITENKKQAENKPIRQAKQYIQKNYMTPISLEEVSNAVGFNTSYFSTLFKKITDQNFLEYLSEVRMEKAKDFLKETNLSIAEICENVGYKDLKHFTKTFVKYTGLKPSEYRKLYS